VDDAPLAGQATARLAQRAPVGAGQVIRLLSSVWKHAGTVWEACGARPPPSGSRAGDSMLTRIRLHRYRVHVSGANILSQPKQSLERVRHLAEHAAACGSEEPRWPSHAILLRALAPLEGAART
jgi:hypothetical protein